MVFTFLAIQNDIQSSCLSPQILAVSLLQLAPAPQSAGAQEAEQLLGVGGRTQQVVTNHWRYDTTTVT